MGLIRWVVVVVVPAALIGIGNAVSLYGSTWREYGVQIVAGTALLGAMSQGYAEWRRPMGLKDRRKLLTMILEKARDDYRREVKPGKGQLNIRLCVMRYRFQGPYFWKRTLAVEDSLGTFTAAERDLRFSKAEGACGMAIRDNDVTWYDRDADPTAEANMTPIQKEATRNVQSVLCLPIYTPDDEDREYPIGVLVVDSTSGIQRTKFNDTSIHSHLATAASMIGGVVG